MAGEKKGLNNTTIALMVSVALFYDALQWLLGWIFMGWLVTIFAGLTFYVWFKMRGMSFMSPKRFTAFGGSFIVEFIPVIGDVLPAWTACIVYLALDSKIKKIAAVVPGGEMAVGALSNKAQMAQTNRNIANQAAQINQPASIAKNGGAPSQTGNSQRDMHSPQFMTQMNKWEDVTKRSNDAQRSEIRGGYKGGMEKYQKDDEKFTADRLRMEEGQTKLKNARAAYLEEDRNLNKAA